MIAQSHRRQEVIFLRFAAGQLAGQFASFDSNMGPDDPPLAK